jgi:hypothetical protein
MKYGPKTRRSPAKTADAFDEFEQYFKDYFDKLAPANPPEGRKEWRVADAPTRCSEYISVGIGDEDCPGKPLRLSRGVSRCPVCGGVYIFPPAI